MLILTRKPGESIYIGDRIKITIVEIKGNQIRVGIEAPKDERIYREEIWLQIREENQQAAEAAASSEAGLEGLPMGFGSGKKSGAKGLSALSTAVAKPSSTGSQESPEVVKRRKRKKDD